LEELISTIQQYHEQVSTVIKIKDSNNEVETINQSQNLVFQLSELLKSLSESIAQISCVLQKSQEKSTVASEEFSGAIKEDLKLAQERLELILERQENLMKAVTSGAQNEVCFKSN